MISLGNKGQGMAAGRWVPVALMLALVAVVVAGGMWLASPSLPTRAEAEASITAIADEDGHLGARAVCEEPTNPDGWGCRLRDGSGAWGLATGSVEKRSAPEGDAGVFALEQNYWFYEFPVDGAGISSDVVGAGGRWTIAESLRYRAQRAMEAVGIAAPQSFDCTGETKSRVRNYAREALASLGPPVGESMSCMGEGPIRSAVVERLDPSSARITFRVPVP